ncbi:hypothetical protein FGW84_00095, partial [Xylella fastidiosa subsp. multiplex]|nr:hypothetical protein [Xylella fastidiosa subsp. multiplex]
MNKFTAMTDRALKHTMDLAQQPNDRIRRTAPQASQGLKSGAALAVVKSSGKVTGKLIKRNTSIAVAGAAVSA